MRKMKLIRNSILAVLLISILSSCNSDKGKTSSQANASSALSNSTSSNSVNDKLQYTTIDKVWNFKEPQKGDTVATLKTTMGDIKLVFFKEVAPKAVENFLTHAKNGYYNGVIFHRVIKDFMIQSGDPQGNGTGGQSIWGTGFEEEVSNTALNFRGALCMARTSAPNSNGSQFYIVQAKTITDEYVQSMKQAGYPDEIIQKYKEVGGTPWLDLTYTVFGRVLSGMEVVDRISEVSTNDMDKPLVDIKINTIDISTY